MIILCDSKDRNQVLKTPWENPSIMQKMYKSHLKMNYHKKAHIRNYYLPKQFGVHLVLGVVFTSPKIIKSIITTVVNYCLSLKMGFIFELCVIWKMVESTLHLIFCLRYQLKIPNLFQWAKSASWWWPNFWKAISWKPLIRFWWLFFCCDSFCGICWNH